MPDVRWCAIVKYIKVIWMWLAWVRHGEPQWCLLDTLLVASDLKQAFVKVMQGSLHYFLEGGVLSKECGIRLSDVVAVWPSAHKLFLSLNLSLSCSICLL